MFYKVFLSKIIYLIAMFWLVIPNVSIAKKHIHVSFPAHPHYDIAIKLLPEFTRQTGIHVTVDQLQYQTMRAKQALELSKPVGDYDLISYVVTSRPDYVAIGKLYPLKVFFNDPELVSKNYNPDDLISAYIDTIGVQEDTHTKRQHFLDNLYGIPFGAETSILGYRQDILEKYNLPAPKTYNELLTQACYLHKKEPNIAGITTRGRSGHHLTHAFLLHLAPLGGRILDHNMSPVFNNKIGIQAAQTLEKILNCSPYGANSFGFGEMKNNFLQGKSVFFLDSTIVIGEVNNSQKSKIINKVSWALHPKALRFASQTGGFGLAIPNNAHNSKDAFKLLQWLTSPKIDKKIALMGGNPSRYSSHLDKTVLHKYPHMSLLAKALKHADSNWRPIIPEWNEIDQIIGTELSKAYSKHITLQKALDNAAQRVRKVLEKKH